MNWIIANIKWIMLVSGVLTCTMIFPALAPQAALLATFGATLPEHPLTEIVVRNWGALITLVGAMLIYGAYNPINRSFILAVAGMSKVIFIGLVLVFGSQYLDKAGIAVVFDSIVVVLYFVYLMGVRQKQGVA
ncbi:MAG: hypothetical protein H9535_06405 [Ignavibacteria bacterium]|nr:hypothetical protein [Ignavibacteria bacterium]